MKKKTLVILIVALLVVAIAVVLIVALGKDSKPTTTPQPSETQSGTIPTEETEPAIELPIIDVDTTEDTNVPGIDFDELIGAASEN